MFVVCQYNVLQLPLIASIFFHEYILSALLINSIDSDTYFLETFKGRCIVVEGVLNYLYSHIILPVDVNLGPVGVGPGIYNVGKGNFRRALVFHRRLSLDQS